MRIGIPAEVYPGETRVAATPETVKKLTAGGRHSVIIETNAGAACQHSRRELCRGRGIAGMRGRRLSDRRHHPQSAPAGGFRAAVAPPRRHPHRPPLASRGRRRVGQDGRDGVRDGTAAAHHAGADHGRALLAGQHRRLQGRADCGLRVRAVHADADDRGRHRQGRPGAHPRSGSRGSAGHRHRQETWSRDRSVRRPARP